MTGNAGKAGQAHTNRKGQKTSEPPARPEGDIVTAKFSTYPLAVILEGSTHDFAKWLAKRIKSAWMDKNAPNSTSVWVPVPLNLRLFRRSTKTKQMVFEFRDRDAATRFATNLDHSVQLGNEQATFYNVYVGRAE